MSLNCTLNDIQLNFTVISVDVPEFLPEIKFEYWLRAPKVEGLRAWWVASRKNIHFIRRRSYLRAQDDQENSNPKKHEEKTKGETEWETKGKNGKKGRPHGGILSGIDGNTCYFSISGTHHMFLQVNLGC